MVGVRPGLRRRGGRGGSVVTDLRVERVAESAVTVCSTLSELTTVTVAPGVTVSGALNFMSAMEIFGPAAVAVADAAALEDAAEGLSGEAVVVVVPDEQPVTNSRVANASVMRRVIARTRIDGCAGSF